MDKRRTQRILGILVIIALSIILFPLLFGKNEISTQTTSVSAPAFPAPQATPITTADNNNSDDLDEDPFNTTPSNDDLNTSSNKQDTLDGTSVDTPPVALPEAAPPVQQPETLPRGLPEESKASPAAKKLPVAKTTVSKSTTQPLEIREKIVNQAISPIKPTQPVPPQQPIPPAKPIGPIKAPTVQSKNKDSSNTNPVILITEEENTRTISLEKTIPKKSTSNTISKIKTPLTLDYHDVAKLNKPAWIVQMGSFRNKGNAQNLADKLRAAGYNAFTKDVKSAQGNLRTRVYVGPEFKEAAATKTSLKIQQQMNLPSIVLPYKPLAL